MDQGKRATSLSTTRLSPLAKPFTLNRSVHTPSSNSSLVSPQLPSVPFLGQCNDDPFSSLLDSFRKSNMGVKIETVPVETSAHKKEKSVLEQNPSAEYVKNGDFDGVKWSHFEILESSSPSIPSYSSSTGGLGYGSCIKGGVGGSADGNVLQGNHAVDGLNPSKAISDGIFNNSIDTIGGKDILSNSKGTINTADESSSFILPNSSNKVAPLKFSTDASNAKNIPQNQSSKITGGDTDLDPDPEVDSPCWKGTIAFDPTPSDISGSAQIHHVEKVTDKHNSLNPLAPQFFPGSGYIKNDLVSSSSSAPVSANLLSGDDLLMNTVVAESPLELNKGIELQHSTNICGREKAFNMLNDPKSCSVEPLLNSYSMMTQSSSKVDCSTTNGKMVTVVDVDGLVKGTKDKRATESKNGVFTTNGYSPTPTSSSYGVGVVTNLFETLKGFSMSSIESPKPDVHIMVSTMHVLSELLVQTCLEGGVDSYDEPDSEMILQIINNLNVFSIQKIEQKTPLLDSTHADSPFCLGRSSSELPKVCIPTFKGLEVTSIETLSVPNQLHSQSDYMGRNNVPKVFAQGGRHISLASSSHLGTEKGDEFTQLQIIRRNLGKKLDLEKQMHPEASLFWNLWLDSEAERCYRKFKTVHYLMEAGIDVNSTNIAELLR